MYKQLSRNLKTTIKLKIMFFLLVQIFVLFIILHSQSRAFRLVNLNVYDDVPYHAFYHVSFCLLTFSFFPFWLLVSFWSLILVFSLVS